MLLILLNVVNFHFFSLSMPRFGIEFFLPALEKAGVCVHSTVLQHSQCSLIMEDADESTLSKSGDYDYLFDGMSRDLLDCTSFLFVSCTR